MHFGEEWTILEYRPAAWLRVSGEDAAGYLQGQFSQDLRGLAVGASVYGLLLNHKGRIQADGFVVRGADCFWIMSYGCEGSALRARLEAFIVADDVIIDELTAEYAGLTLMLPLASPTSSDGSVAEAARAFGHTAIPGRRGLSPSYEFIFPLSEAMSARARFPAAGTAPPAFWERTRIEAGIPWVPRDAGPGDLPQETGLTAAAVSFNKGCYLGQEIMARLKTRGRVRRQLRQVRGPQETQPVPLQLWSGDKLAGELRSWTSDGQGAGIGLAMLPADALREAKYSLAVGEALCISQSV